MSLRIGGFDMTDVIGTGGQGEAPSHFPFEITVAQDENKNYQASIRPGVVNHLLPSNIFQEFPVGAGTHFVKLRCATDGKTPNSITLEINSNNQPLGMQASSNVPPQSFIIFLGVIVVTSNPQGGSSAKVLQIVTTNLMATPFLAFQETKVPNTPGEEPFVRWWKWNVLSSENYFYYG